MSTVLAMCKLKSHKKDRSTKSPASRWLLSAQDYFAPRIVHMGFQVDRMAQGQTSLRVLLYFLSVIIPPLLLVNTFIAPRCRSSTKTQPDPITTTKMSKLYTVAV